MVNKRILSVQDVSCVGQCSLSVSLPILSAMGYECSILPTALLSTHTAFSHTSFFSLEDTLPKVLAAWQAEDISFDGICTGYIGSVPSVRLLKTVFTSFLAEDAPIIVDPVMGDNGSLYRHFHDHYVQAVRELLPFSHVILPNLTEACFLTGTRYEERCDGAFLKELHEGLRRAGAKAAIITGLPISSCEIGISVDVGDGHGEIYTTKRIPRASHGAGDVFASCFTGYSLKGFSPLEAACRAADFTCLALENTADEHWYGLSFEPLLPRLFEKD